MKRAAVVLCGGKSTRMGRPKAWLPWFGRTLIEHVVWNLGQAVDEVIVVTSDALDIPPVEARLVRDRTPSMGPLAGIRDGLEAAGADWVFVTSTDAPFVTPEHVEKMLGHACAVAPVAEGFVQVLSAVYPGDAWKEADRLLQAVGASDRKTPRARPLTLLEAFDYQALPCEEFKEPFPWQGFNRPLEYLACARQVDPNAAACVELLGVAALNAAETRFRSPIGLLGEVLEALPDCERLGLIQDGRVARRHLVSLGGRELVRDLALPVGPGERVSVIDAQAGG